MPVSGKKSPPDTDDIGLPLPQIGGIQPLRFALVEFGAFDQIIHPLKFQLVGRHKQLPACFKGDTVVPAKLLWRVLRYSTQVLGNMWIVNKKWGTAGSRRGSRSSRLWGM